MKEIRRPIFSIGVAASLVGVPPVTIRKWERAGLVTAARGANRWRMYSWQDIEGLQRVRDLSRRGLSATEIRRRLRRRPAVAARRERVEVAAAPALRRLSGSVARSRPEIIALPVAVRRA